MTDDRHRVRLVCVGCAIETGAVDTLDELADLEPTWMVALAHRARPADVVLDVVIAAPWERRTLADAVRVPCDECGGAVAIGRETVALLRELGRVVVAA
jgi:hypothetical protein